MYHKNINKISCFLLICLCTATIGACTFKPDEVFYKDIQKPDGEASYVIDFDGLVDGETIYIRTHSLNIQLNVSDYNYISSAAYIINDKSYALNSYNIKEIEINYDDLEYDENTLELSFVINSGLRSGSIADKLKKEGEAVTKSFTIMKLPLETPVLDQYRMDIWQGYLRIWFSPYPYSDLYHYKVYAYNSRGANSQLTYSGQINTNEFIDSAFVETKLSQTYVIEAKARSGYVSPLRINFNPQDAILHDLQFSTKGQNTLEVKWPKCKYYSAFDKYQIAAYGFNNYTHDDPLVFDITNINDTVLYIPDVPYGKPVSVKYRILSSKADSGELWHSNDIALGEEVPLSSSVCLASTNSDIIYYLDGINSDRHIALYQPHLNKVKGKIWTQAEYLFSSQNALVIGGVNSDQSIVIVNQASQTIAKAFKIPEFKGNIAADENGCIYYFVKEYWPKQSQKLYKYDYNSQTRILLDESDTEFRQIHINGNGSYIILDGSLYFIQNNTLQAKALFDDACYAHYFLPASNYCLLECPNKRLVVYNLDNESVVNIIDMQYDSFTLSSDRKKLVLTNNNEETRTVVDILSGEIIGSVNVNFFSAYYSHFGEYLYFWPASYSYSYHKRIKLGASEE